MHIMIQCGKCFLIKISEKEDITSLHMHADLVQSLSHVQLFATPWTAALQASLCFTTSQSLLKLMSIESPMLSNHLVLCPLLLLPPSIFPSIRVFSNKSTLHIRWPKYWSFSFSIGPSNEHSGDLLQDGQVGSPCSPRDSQESSPTPQFKFQKHQFFSTQLSSQSNSNIHT